MTAMYSRTVTMCKASHLRNYIAQEVGYNVDFTFNYDIDEVRATFTCSDDFADPNLRHNSEDLETYIIKRYGSFLIKEGIPNPTNFAMDMKKIGEVLTNPQLNKRDNYQDDYEKIIGDDTWLELKRQIPDIKFDERIQTSSYTKDAYKIRMGTWHG